MNQSFRYGKNICKFVNDNFKTNLQSDIENDNINIKEKIDFNILTDNDCVLCKFNEDLLYVLNVLLNLNKKIQVNDKETL